MSYLIYRGTDLQTGLLQELDPGKDSDAPVNGTHLQCLFVQDLSKWKLYKERLHHTPPPPWQRRILPNIVERTNQIMLESRGFSNAEGLQGTRLALDVNQE